MFGRRKSNEQLPPAPAAPGASDSVTGWTDDDTTLVDQPVTEALDSGSVADDDTTPASDQDAQVDQETATQPLTKAEQLERYHAPLTKAEQLEILDLLHGFYYGRPINWDLYGSEPYPIETEYSKNQKNQDRSRILSAIHRVIQVLSGEVPSHAGDFNFVVKRDDMHTPQEILDGIVRNYAFLEIPELQGDIGIGSSGGTVEIGADGEVHSVGYNGSNLYDFALARQILGNLTSGQDDSNGNNYIAHLALLHARSPEDDYDWPREVAKFIIRDEDPVIVPKKLRTSKSEKKEILSRLRSEREKRLRQLADENNTN
jgi:hypothetical protein